MMDVSGFQSADMIVGDNEEDTEQLRAQFQDACEYIRAFSWSEPIERAYFAFGVGGIFALFLFVFEKAIGGTDKELWVVAGDLPSAYFVTEGSESIDGAVDTYCALMEDWALAVEHGDTETEAFPVNTPRTQSNAEALKMRIAFLRDNFL